MENISEIEQVHKEKKTFFPYQDKTRTAYFSYFGLFLFFGLLVIIFSFFVIINLSVNQRYNISTNINDLNIFLTPIFNIVLILISLVLLLFAPQRIYHSPKQSSVMFYFSFWMLVIAVMLNANLQLTYADNYSDIYHWVNFSLVKVWIVISVISLFLIEVFFWIMRRKFAFLPSDYEIYTTRSDNKKQKRNTKREAKRIKKQEKLIAKIKKSKLKDTKRRK